MNVKAFVNVDVFIYSDGWKRMLVSLYYREILVLSLEKINFRIDVNYMLLIVLCVL